MGQHARCACLVCLSGQCSQLTVSPAPCVSLPSPHPGLEIDEGNFYWAEPPPKKPEPGKKGAPLGSQPASKPGSKAPSRRGSFFKRSKSQQALEGGKAGGAEAAANGKAANGEVVAVELPAMKEEHGEGAANGAANGTANGTAPPASPEKPVGDDLSDSAQEGPGSSGPPSPPPEKAAGRGGKEGAWWLRGINLRVREGAFRGQGGQGLQPFGLAAWLAALPAQCTTRLE